MWVAFAHANAKAIHIFFCQNISVYVIFNDQSFNDTLTNDIVSFEQLDPGIFWPFSQGAQILWLTVVLHTNPVQNGRSEAKQY